MTKKKERTAVYIGTADVRIITREDFKRNQGFDPGEMFDLVWHAGNRFALPVEDLPTEVQDHLNDIEPDIMVQDGIPENLIPFLRLKAQTVQPSGRVAGVQAAEGRREFESPPGAVSLADKPVISPEAPLVNRDQLMADAPDQINTASGEGQAPEGGGNSNPVTTAGGSTDDSTAGTTRGTRGRTT